MAKSTKSPAGAKRPARPVNKAATISYSIEQNGDRPGGHRMVIGIKPDTGITRVEAAYMTPAGNLGIQRARKNGGSTYEAFIRSSEPGEFKISIAAYGRRSILGLLSARYTIAEPDGHAFPSGRTTKVIDIPEPPSEIRKREVKSWPISSAYAKSLQNLNFSISESYPDLRSGKLKTNPNVKFTSYIYGSGNFGVVFKLELEQKFRALKCFTRAAPDIAERYYYLSSYLSQVSLPFLVNFRYLSKAVRVPSKPKEFYPALMMDWVEGQNVNQFIEKHLDNPSLIQLFAKNFISSVNTMQSMGVAHGDLSGDNILVTDKADVTFIDYDGMFIPNLAGRNPPEKGHENFQHPSRNNEYSENLDNFSALIIYLTAEAVAEDRNIWKYNTSDQDRLIFTSNDFSDPSVSPVFNSLREMGKKTKKLTALLENFLKQPPLWGGASPRILMSI